MLQTAPSHHIPPHVASLAIEAFTALAHAEMHTHGAESIDQVHFHEVGAVDSIVDTVGTLLALYHLGVDLGDGKGVAVTCSPLPLYVLRWSCFPFLFVILAVLISVLYFFSILGERGLYGQIMDCFRSQLLQPCVS